MPGTARRTIVSLCVVAVVSALTLASRVGIVSADALSASPQRIEHGKVWLLVSNGLLVQRPLSLCLFSFVLLIFLTPIVCGTRVFVVSAAVGHIGSTLLAYALVGGVYAIDPHAVRSVVSYPDYGVSAIQAAWIGAIAATLWRRGPARRRRALIVAAVLAISAVAWAVRRDLTLLDTDHFFAFVIGATLAAWGSVSVPVAQLTRRLLPRNDATPAAAMRFK